MILESYACSASNSRGRVYKEQQTPYRNEFERDRDRIIHSNAFKRLQYKTQVFVNHEGDHYRNRMTHSIEVSSIARSLCKALNLSDDLVEGVALAHDLGHSPFGHAGEEVLNECMKDFGGFSHNAHSFKILTLLEQKYASYNGLNLTWEVLEGIVKHNGPLEKNKTSEYILKYDEKYDLDLQNYSSAESQIASLSDDIAYVCHDLEDSVNADVITYKDLEEVEFVDRYIRDVQKKHEGLAKGRTMYEVSRKLTHHLIESLLSQTKLNIKKYNIKTEKDIRCLGKPLVEFTQPVMDEIISIKKFLLRKVYKHHKVVSVTMQCQNIIKALFELYASNIDLLPLSWKMLIEQGDEKAKMSLIADYIAGMTDRFAIKQYQLFYNLKFTNIDL